MSKFKDFIKSPHIQIAFATGIVTLAYFSKKIFTNPIGNTINAIPGFIMLLHELLFSKYKGSKIFTAIYWTVFFCYSINNNSEFVKRLMR